MSGIDVKINSREIEAALGRVMAARTRRKAVNEAGAKARRDIPALLAELYSTSKSAVGARGKAAGPGSTDPVYTLRVNRRIRLGKLKAGARKFESKRGERLGRLKLTQPQKSGAKGVDVFRATKAKGGANSSWGQARAGALAASAGRPCRSARIPAIRERRDRIVEDLAKAVAEGIEGAIRGKGR